MNKTTTAIKIVTEPYSYETTGGYDKDCISTNYTARSIVTILDLVKKFDDDQYLHKAKKWINKTFATDEYNNIKNRIECCKIEILRQEKELEYLNKQLNEFLIPVTIVKN